MENVQLESTVASDLWSRELGSVWKVQIQRLDIQTHRKAQALVSGSRGLPGKDSA